MRVTTTGSSCPRVRLVLGFQALVPMTLEDIIAFPDTVAFPHLHALEGLRINGVVSRAHRLTICATWRRSTGASSLHPATPVYQHRADMLLQGEAGEIPVRTGTRDDNRGCKRDEKAETS